MSVVAQGHFTERTLSLSWQQLVVWLEVMSGLMSVIAL